jgi:hypothetical protein
MPGSASSAPSSNRRSQSHDSSPDNSDEDRIILNRDDDDSDNDNHKTCFTDEHLLLMDPTPPSSPENEKEIGANTNDADARETSPMTAVAAPRQLSSSLSSIITSKLDSGLQTYVKYMSTSLHQDRGLKLLQWSLWLASRLVLLKKYQSNNSSGLQYLSQSLRKLYLDFSFARYATRAFGLPSAVVAARNGSWGYQESNTLTKYRKAHDVLGKLMAWSMIGYYPTELVAYIQWILPAKPEGQLPAKYSRSAERWSYWSCRFWLAYLVAEACQCLLVYKELKDQETQRQDGSSDNVNGDKHAKADRQGIMRYTKLQLIRDALFVLPCINWSLPNWDIDPMLPENVVNGLMWLESIVCLYQ